jgi:hypothetical protein
MKATSTVNRTAVRPRRRVDIRHAGRATRPAGCRSAVVTARPVPPRPEQAPAQRGTHLTTRGRVVAVLVLALLLLGAFSLGRTGAEGSTTVQPQLETVVVMPGDTLWAVAQRLAPGEDPRPVVDQIRELNDLRSAELQVGQQLLLPVWG